MEKTMPMKKEEGRTEKSKMRGGGEGDEDDEREKEG